MQNTILSNLLASSARPVGQSREASPRSEAEARPSPAEPHPAVSEVELAAAVKQISDYIQIVRRDLQFTVDENSGRTVITVIDSETKEVIRQIPPEEIVSLAAHLERTGAGLIEARA